LLKTGVPLTQKRWIFAEQDRASSEKLAAELKISPTFAQILLNRGIKSAESARKFLQPRLQNLTDPFELPAMHDAVETIQSAIRDKKRITIYGDYDVDGITSSALLTKILRAADATVANFLPNRMDEGYGLSADGIARCIAETNPQLLIAVDCGTSSHAEISNLKSNNIDVIVLDHHEPPEKLPDCALVNPKLVEKITPWSHLASVGVTFKVCHALLKSDPALRKRADLRDFLDLVAIGTIADIVPLVDENRIFAKIGLERLAHTDNIGLQTLMKLAAVPKNVNAYHVGFRIGPRLNAAGRLADAMAALQLLLTDDAQKARELAELLHAHNAERQQIERKITDEAFEMAREIVEKDDQPVLVLAKTGWHVGVIGIVASRIVQEFYQPTVILGIEGDTAKGSCRSITGFSIGEALQKCAPLLEKFGGHEMAAGLSLDARKIDEFREKLNEIARKILSADALVPRLFVDADVKLGDLDENFVRQLKQFEPFGVENPEPIFAARGVRSKFPPRIMKEKHVRLVLADGEISREAVGFGMATRKISTETPLDVAFTVEFDEWHGDGRVQLKLKDVREAAA
jgi:single-stranded-DNA-specific exonuclease